MNRWRRRPVLAAAVRVLVLLLPLLVAAAAGWAAAGLAAGLPYAGRALLVLLVTVGTVLAVDRLARRLLPLAALLRLALLFPDRAPDRLRTALRAGSTRELVRARAQAPPDAAAAAQRLLVLLAAVARHDPATRRHCERVRAYVDLLGEALDLPPARRDRLRWAALVHDLGKTEIDRRLLRKPGRLDAAEWHVVRGHPAAGERLAEGLREFLGPEFGAIGEHHERWDGTGYPRGLAGEGISQAGRIVAVADALEVMTAGRPYHRPVDPAQARAELVRCGGTQFDPAVVRALLGISLRRLRRVLGPLALLGTLPVLGHGLLAHGPADPAHLLHAGSDAGLPAAPPHGGGLPVGLHPAAALAHGAAAHAGVAGPVGHPLHAGGPVHDGGGAAGVSR